MNKIRIILERTDTETHEALGSYIGVMDEVVYNLKQALNIFQEDPERAHRILSNAYNYARKRHMELQDDLGYNPLHEKNPIQESRYSQFKKQAVTRQPSEAVHRSIREMYKKMRELKKIIEYANRMKQEMNQGNNYKKRTVEALQKLTLELKDISSMLRKEWKVKQSI